MSPLPQEVIFGVTEKQKQKGIDFRYLQIFSDYYQKTKNHQWMKFRMDNKSHEFAYKAFVHGIERGRTIERNDQGQAVINYVSEMEYFLKLSRTTAYSPDQLKESFEKWVLLRQASMLSLS